MDDVQVGQTRLHHHDVGAFLLIELGFGDGFAGVGRIHLVRGFVLGDRLAGGSAGGRIQGLAEGAVVGGGVLGRVADDAHVLEALLIQGLADGADAAVHHVAGADQVGAGAGLGNRLLAQDRHGLVVEHYALAADDAVMAVAGVGVEGHVGHDRHARVDLLQAANGAGDQAALVEAFSAVFCLEAVGHLREQHHAADAQIPGAANLLHQTLEAPALAAGHGTDRLVRGALVHEQWIDEIGRAEGGFAHHRPQGRRAAQAAGTVGELHQWRGASRRAGRILRSAPGATAQSRRGAQRRAEVRAGLRPSTRCGGRSCAPPAAVPAAGAPPRCSWLAA